MIGNLIPYVIMIAAGVAAVWRQAPYDAIPFLALMALWYTVRMVISSYDPEKVTEQKDNGREKVLTTLVFIGMVIVPIVTVATPVLDFAAYRPLPGQLWLGMAVGVIGTVVFWRSHADLGTNWSAHLEIRDDHTLITNGIYSAVRHPMYLAIFLVTVAQTLMLANFIGGPAGLAAFLLLYVLRVGPEEALMRKQFGEQYDAYMEKTPRLIPRLSGT